MKKLKATPGPYGASPDHGHMGFIMGRIACKCGKPHKIAEVLSVTGTPACAENKLPYIANTCLLASAPELLQALKAARDFIHAGGSPTASIDAVIAKAEGRVK